MAKTGKWSEERKQAARDRFAASQNKNPKIEQPIVEQPPIKTGTTEIAAPSKYEADDIAELKRQIQELKDMHWQSMMMQNKQEATVSDGKIKGTFEKYSTAKGKYPSPVERLKEEARLKRFAFPINYELNFETSISTYTTLDGIRTKEPKFTLELIRVMMDEDTGEPTNGRYIICRLIMHEDPEAALVIAEENDLIIENESEEAFLNEMRYLRMRDWLLECFYPAPVKSVKNQREIVIDGRLVSYFEVNNEQGKGLSKTDWDTVPKIKF